LDTYHPDIPPLGEQRSEDPWLFFESKRGPRENTALDHTSQCEISIGGRKVKRLMVIKKSRSCQTDDQRLKTQEF